MTNAAFYANTVEASLPFVLDDIRTDEGIYPPEPASGGLFTRTPHSQEFLRLRNRAWSAFKYAQ